MLRRVEQLAETITNFWNIYMKVKNWFSYITTNMHWYFSCEVGKGRKGGRGLRGNFHLVLFVRITFLFPDRL